MRLNANAHLTPHLIALDGHYAHEPAWWPLHGADRHFEVTLGMVLVQQTRWEVVEAAVLRLLNTGITSFAKLAAADPTTIAALCKPAAFATRKGEALVRLAQHIITLPDQLHSILAQPRPQARQQLLALPQIGRESADTILLYAGDVPLFIVDAYARRLIARIGVYANHSDALNAPYDLLQAHIEADLGPIDAQTARNIHAMMVEACIHHCTARNPRCERSGYRRTFVDPRKCAEHCPPCDGCPLAPQCVTFNLDWRPAG